MLKYIGPIIVGIALIGGCASTCNCNCPYCCGGDQIDYNSNTNKPISDQVIWWKENK